MARNRLLSAGDVRNSLGAVQKAREYQRYFETMDGVQGVPDGGCTYKIFWASPLGPMFVLMGLGFLSRPMMVYTGSAIEMKNLLGMTVKTHEVPDPALLDVEPQAVMYDGRVVLGRFTTMAARGSDWTRFQEVSSG